MVAVRIDVGQREVGVVPADPPGRARDQAVVQHLPVVVTGVLVGGERRGDAELLQHDGFADVREFAGERGPEQLANRIVAHRVDVRPDEVDQVVLVGEPEPVVAAGHLDRPRAITQRHRQVRAARPHRLGAHDRPGARGLPGRRAAEQRDLVGDQPARDGRRVTHPPHDLGDEERLLAEHEPVGVQVPVTAPGRREVLPGHVPDDEGRDGGDPEVGARHQEPPVPLDQLIVHGVGSRVEVRPEHERPGHVQAVLDERAQFRAHQVVVVLPPHERAARARPEVDPQPRLGSQVCAGPVGLTGHGV